MEGDRQKAERYRERGVEIRKIAQDMMEPAVRKTLLQVADDYDEMARTLDGIGDADAARAIRMPPIPSDARPLRLKTSAAFENLEALSKNWSQRVRACL